MNGMEHDGTTTFQRFALGKVSILIVREDARPIAPYDTLKETIVNLFTNSLSKLRPNERKANTLNRSASMRAGIDCWDSDVLGDYTL
jgi:hypothetical protein